MVIIGLHYDLGAVIKLLPGDILHTGMYLSVVIISNERKGVTSYNFSGNPQRKAFSKAATFSENDGSLEKQSDADRSISRPKAHGVGEQINQTTFYHLNVC